VFRAGGREAFVGGGRGFVCGFLGHDPCGVFVFAMV
jgi:hypothetical protein